MSDFPTPPAPDPGSIGRNRLNSYQSAATQEPTPRRRELRRIAAAIRGVIHGLVGTDADTEVLADAADVLEDLAAVFANAEPRTNWTFAEAATSGDAHSHFDHSPILGVANPIAPPVTIEVVTEDTVEASAIFGAAYEGPPGCVHGGFVAAAFDDVLGLAQSLSGQAGMTGNLSIAYRSPTPLHEEVRLVARIDRVEGRKIFTTGTLHAGTRLCAEATAVFISVDFARFAELQERRRAQAAGRAASDETN